MADHLTSETERPWYVFRPSTGPDGSAQGTNETLWASFLLITPNATIYFGGDSGYFMGYREFGKKYPGIDYALISVGAYHPRWFMHYAHLDVQGSPSGS